MATSIVATLTKQTSVQPAGCAKPSGGFFIEEIRKNINQALSSASMSIYKVVLWEELNHVLVSMGLEEIECDTKLMAKWLTIALQQGGSECLVITQALSGSVFRCFDPDEDADTYEKAQPFHKDIKKGVERILGYLVLSLVNPEDALSLTKWLDYKKNLSELYFELRVRTFGGIEIFMSSQQRRKADIELDSDGKDITGKYLIFVDTTPFQWSERAKLRDTQLIVWNKFYREERREALTEDDLSKLKAELKIARVRRRNPANYCIVVEFDDEGDRSYVEQCSAFLSKLDIPLVRYKVGEHSAAFNGLEHNLMGAVKQFLTDFNECIYR
jgi:hypothetical protein